MPKPRGKARSQLLDGTLPAIKRRKPSHTSSYSARSPHFRPRPARCSAALLIGKVPGARRASASCNALYGP